MQSSLKKEANGHYPVMAVISRTFWLCLPAESTFQSQHQFSGGEIHCWVSGPSFTIKQSRISKHSKATSVKRYDSTRICRNTNLKDKTEAKNDKTRFWNKLILLHFYKETKNLLHLSWLRRSTSDTCIYTWMAVWPQGCSSILLRKH